MLLIWNRPLPFWIYLIPCIKAALPQKNVLIVSMKSNLGMYFRYPGTDNWALRHVSMKFHIGTRLAIVGENGSGKTTFIKLLCRLYDPQEGEILLNDINIRKYKYKDYMEIFSIVFRTSSFLASPLVPM